MLILLGIDGKNNAIPRAERQRVDEGRQNAVGLFFSPSPIVDGIGDGASAAAG
jgi:hypothetical protein